jgi:hypothetical protein
MNNYTKRFTPRKYKKWFLKKKITKTAKDWMLRITIYLNEVIDMSKFSSVVAYLKRKVEGYAPKSGLL